LRGRGNVSHWEMSLCFTFRREGWRLVYDPAIAVDHHIAPRFDGDINARGGFERESYVDSVHTEAIAILEHLPPVRRNAYRVWQWGVGTIGTPGLLQVLRRRLKFGDSWQTAWARYKAAREGMDLADQTLSHS
jgi:hypothetical protein